LLQEIGHLPVIDVVTGQQRTIREAVNSPDARDGQRRE